LKADHPHTGITDASFCSCDLHLDLMTLIHEYDPDILKMYLQAKNELSRSRISKVKALQTDREKQTDRHVLL